MRITVDTNVLISATFWSGDSERIIIKAEKKEVTLVLSKEIIEEYNRVLNYEEIKEKIQNKNLDFRLPIEKIITIAELVAPKEKVQVIKDDPDDDKILECALAGKVSYIVSSDKHLLKLTSFRNIKIITPAAFLALLK